MSIIIDFEGFMLESHTYVVKELAAYSFDGNILLVHWTFKPPRPFEELNEKDQKQCRWITRNLHGIQWEQGELAYENFRHIMGFLFKMYEKIYVKGYEKTKFIETLSSRNCYNLDDLGCPKINNLPEKSVICPHHHLKNHCALAKVICFRD